MNPATVQQALLAQLAAHQEATSAYSPLSIFRKALGVVLLCLALLFLVLNMIVLGHFGWGLGQNHIEKWVQMIAAGALPVMITAIHPTYVMTWRPGHWMLSAKGRVEYKRARPNYFLLITLTLLAVVALTINFVGGIGVMATARKSVDLKAVGAVDEERRLKESRSRLEGQRAAVPTHRPAETVAPLLASHKLHPFWQRTSSCSEVINRAQRNYCGEYGKLQAELAAARESTKLNEEIASLDSLLAGSSTRVDLQAGSSQTEALSLVTGMRQEDIQVRLSLLFPILLELMTLVPMVGAMYAFRINHGSLQDIPEGSYQQRPSLPPPARPQEPPQRLKTIDHDQDLPRVLMSHRPEGESPVRMRAVFDEFWSTRMRRSESGMVPESTVFTLYSTFCAQQFCQSFDLESFRRLSAGHVRATVEIGGEVNYCHIAPA